MKFGYTSNEACKVANISYRQLHYWDKTNLVKPSIAAAHGTGSRRIYSFIDLVCLRVTAKLKQEGVSLHKIRKSIAYLNSNFLNCRGNNCESKEEISMDVALNYLC